MKVLVLGGTGFLGSHLCECLLKRGHTLGLYYRPTSSNVSNVQKILANEQVVNIQGNFAEETHFNELVHGYDSVYQLISATVPSMNEPLTDLELTVKPMLRLLDACVVNGVKRVVFFSSGGTVYGIPGAIPIKEDHPTEPISSYGIHKLMLEKYLNFYYRMYGLDYTILRIANPYGERQRAFSSQGLIANIMGCCLSGAELEIWGDGSVTRDYVYVKDVVDVAEKVLFYQGKQKIFNVGSGRGYSVNEIIRIVEEVTDLKLKVHNTRGRKQDVPINVLDISRIKQELGWSPHTSLEMGLTCMLNAWDGNRKVFDKVRVD